MDVQYMQSCLQKFRHYGADDATEEFGRTLNRLSEPEHGYNTKRTNQKEKTRSRGDIITNNNLTLGTTVAKP